MVVTRRIIDGVIRDHMTERLTLTFVSATCGCSAEELRRVLGPRAGWRLQSIVARARAERASELIRSGEKFEWAMHVVGLHNKTNLLATCRRYCK